MFITVCSTCLSQLLSFTVYIRETPFSAYCGFLFTEYVEEDINTCELLSAGEETFQIFSYPIGTGGTKEKKTRFLEGHLLVLEQKAGTRR